MDVGTTVTGVYAPKRIFLRFVDGMIKATTTQLPTNVAVLPVDRLNIFAKSHIISLASLSASVSAISVKLAMCSGRVA